MSAADKIKAARALIEPLTDTTPGPWVFSERNTPEHFWIEPEVGYLPMPHYLSVSGPISRENAALIAAAPALRDTVAALADLADAQAQEIARQAQRIEAMESALGWIALMPHSEDCSSQFEDEDFPCDCHVGPADAALGEAS